MSQQINLFNPVFLKKKKYFSAVTMLQALALLLGGSLLFYGYAAYQASILSRQARETDRQMEAVKTRLDQAVAAYAPKQPSKLLEQELQRLDAQLKGRQEVFDILRSGELGNTKGYSDYFRAFSHQVVNGLWLTGFAIHGAGNEIGVNGRALQPELIPQFITNLRREPVMQGKVFSTMEMHLPVAEKKDEKPSDTPRFIEFSLRSEGLNQEKKQ